MIKYYDKKGKKVMEMSDTGKTTIFTEKLEKSFEDNIDKQEKDLEEDAIKKDDESNE